MHIDAAAAHLFRLNSRSLRALRRFGRVPGYGPACRLCLHRAAAAGTLLLIIAIARLRLRGRGRCCSLATCLLAMGSRAESAPPRCAILPSACLPS